MHISISHTAGRQPRTHVAFSHLIRVYKKDSLGDVSYWSEGEPMFSSGRLPDDDDNNDDLIGRDTNMINVTILLLIDSDSLTSNPLQRGSGRSLKSSCRRHASSFIWHSVGYRRRSDAQTGLDDVAAAAAAAQSKRQAHLRKTKYRSYVMEDFDVRCPKTLRIFVRGIVCVVAIEILLYVFSVLLHKL